LSQVHLLLHLLELHHHLTLIRGRLLWLHIELLLL
jgi:hypothetical protein